MRLYSLLRAFDDFTPGTALALEDLLPLPPPPPGDLVDFTPGTVGALELLTPPLLLLLLPFPNFLCNKRRGKGWGL
jgi:hypothetical protein